MAGRPAKLKCDGSTLFFNRMTTHYSNVGVLLILWEMVGLDDGKAQNHEKNPMLIKNPISPTGARIERRRNLTVCNHT